MRDEAARVTALGDAEADAEAAVVGRPDLILADEPTGNVDPAMAVRILKLFAELNRQGVTVLIAVGTLVAALALGLRNQKPISR